MNNHKIFLLGILSVFVVHAMENPLAHESEFKNKVHVVVVPGQNGGGGQNVEEVLPQFANIHRAGTLYTLPDLGQDRCLEHFRKTIDPLLANDDIDDIIIHASSQGTATAINYLAQFPNNKIKLLILEGVLASGNSAIFHTVDKLIMPGVGHIPLSYFLLPYLARFQMPFYSPAGNQPIMNCHKIPENLPIIILHSRKDPQLSFDDAKALHAALVHNNNDNVYLLPIDALGHVILLNKNDKEVGVIHDILKKYRLFPDVIVEKIQELKKSGKYTDEQLSGVVATCMNQKDLSLYQPKPDHAVYAEMIRKEAMFKSIDPCVKPIMVFMLVMGVYKIITKMLVA